MGESALVDKETGRIFWEGGSSNTLAESLGPKIEAQLGLLHIKASLLSGILLIFLAGVVANWLKAQIDQSAIVQQQPRPFYLTSCLFLIQWTILKVPKFQRWFVFAVVILYLLEAYLCSTRRYLANSVEGTEGIETYLERLRDTLPVVEWRVRSFHYVTRTWTAPLAAPFRAWKQIKELAGRHEINSIFESTQEASWLRRKKVTKVSTGSFQFKDCVDKTVVGVWKRANRPIVASPAAFTKIVLTKQLVLADGETRRDYFDQQSQFVTEHCQEDRMAEFSTNIRVDGYRPKLLAVKTANRFFRLHLFWVFTLLGLTVPYRIWFSNHCDEIRVTVIKEASSIPAPVSSGKSWLSSFSSFKKYPRRKSVPDSEEDERKENFRSLMESLKLYSAREQEKDRMKEEEILDLLQSMEAAEILAEEEEKLEEEESVEATTKLKRIKTVGKNESDTMVEEDEREEKVVDLEAEDLVEMENPRKEKSEV